MAVQIEIISDVVCPWCYIGKRRLEAALSRAGAQVEVTWRPFQLNPGLPQEGMEREAYVRRKFGAAGPGLYARVGAVGAAVGIPFAFERIARQPNTLAAHQLIALAAPGAQQDAMVETLFRAYFLEGADLTSHSVLTALAARAGLDPTAAQACLEDEAARQAVVEADGAARDLGVEGVPFFIFGRRLAVSGAQEPEVLVQAIERAAEALPDPA
jgi:predicted DsbA family dithiol-disulfide isomerase